MSNQILLFISLLIILSYFFDYLSKKIRLPSVLFLLACGMLTSIFWRSLGFPEYNLRNILEVLGTVGLILIVLEGALDLSLEKEKLPIIRKSALLALITLLATSGAIAWLLVEHYSVSFVVAWTNAIPLGVVSSAIAIPTAKNLPSAQREFITYDSSLSDILGVMLMNFAVMSDITRPFDYLVFGFDTLLIIVLSTIGAVLLFSFLHYVKLQVKFIFMYALLFLFYSLVKSVHLPGLLLIMFFGLVMNNYLLIRIPKVQNWIKADKTDRELSFLKSINIEGAFLIRTFFFLFFGFSIQISALSNAEIWNYALIICGIIIAIRGISLLLVNRKLLYPTVFIAPRGLITILLFYTIPDTRKIEGFNDNIILAIVIISSLIMIFGTIFSQKEKA